MSRTTSAPHDRYLAPSQVTDEQSEVFLTPKEAAAYLRGSKSYLDKLRVYGGGPKFARPTKRKILYRKSDLDLWASEHRFGSTSEYATDRISPQDDYEPSSNTKKQRATKILLDNSG